MDARHAVVALDGEMNAGRPAADEAGSMAGELERAPGPRPGDDVEGEEGGAVLQGQPGQDGIGPGAEGRETLARLGGGERHTLLLAVVGLQAEELAKQFGFGLGRDLVEQRLDGERRTGCEAGLEAIGQGVDLADQRQRQSRRRRGVLGHGENLGGGGWRQGSIVPRRGAEGSLRFGCHGLGVLQDFREECL